MDLTRRGFLGVTATAAVASLQRTAGAAQDDPLGVRKDFPALRDYTFLNTAYTGLIPQAVVDAAREWTATRAGRTYTVGEMLAKTDEARKLYAGMIGAGEDEIAFLSSTTRGREHRRELARLQARRQRGLRRPRVSQHAGHLPAARGHAGRRDPCRQEPERRRPGRGVREAGRSPDAAHLGGVGQSQQRLPPRHEGARPLAHAHGAYLYSDAVQFIGSGPVDVHAEGVDFCTSGTYKWIMAGFGVAAFYVRRELLDKIHPPNVGWRSQPGEPIRAPRRSSSTRRRRSVNCTSWPPPSSTCSASGWTRSKPGRKRW